MGQVFVFALARLVKRIACILTILGKARRSSSSRMSDAICCRSYSHRLRLTIDFRTKSSRWSSSEKKRVSLTVPSEPRLSRCNIFGASVARLSKLQKRIDNFKKLVIFESRSNMSSTEITLPNGVKYEQPLGAFINNEFVTPSGDKFQVYDPR